MIAHLNTDPRLSWSVAVTSAVLRPTPSDSVLQSTPWRVGGGSLIGTHQPIPTTSGSPHQENNPPSALAHPCSPTLD